MPLTLPLPDWVPWWGQLAILVVAILFGLAFLMMPFAVFGLKSRLDFLEAQLDDIHAELRMLAMRLPEIDRPIARAAPPEPEVQEIRSLRATLRSPSPGLPTRGAESDVARRPRPAPRDPRGIDDWSGDASSYDDEAEVPRRPLRAPPLLREPGPRQPAPRAGDRDRSEPTLRFPPR